MVSRAGLHCVDRRQWAWAWAWTWVPISSSSAALMSTTTSGKILLPPGCLLRPFLRPPPETMRRPMASTSRSPSLAPARLAGTRRYTSPARSGSSAAIARTAAPSPRPRRARPRARAPRSSARPLRWPPPPRTPDAHPARSPEASSRRRRHRRTATPASCPSKSAIMRGDSHSLTEILVADGSDA